MKDIIINMEQKMENNKEIFDMIEYQDLSYDMKYICDVMGIDITRKLLSELSGTDIYIPKIASMHSLIHRYTEKHKSEKSIKQISKHLGVTENHIRNIMKNKRISQ